MTIESAVDPWVFRRGSLVYPYPVAVACGRVLRSRNVQEKVDACLKAAEVLARYLAAVAIASFANREVEDTLTLEPFSGNLSFGHFLNVSQQIAKSSIPHPLAAQLAGFRPRGKGRNNEPGQTDNALVQLLNLRNRISHQLANFNEALAKSILTKDQPEQLLAAALNGVDGLLALPLFVIEEQRVIKHVVRARRLLLMGESSDPPPEELNLSKSIAEDMTPYLAVGEQVLRLPPLLVWGVVLERGNYRLLFLDSVATNSVRFRTIEANESTGGQDAVEELHRLMAGVRRESEMVSLLGGKLFGKEWTERRRLIEEAGQKEEGRIPWDAFDASILRWYASKLKSEEGVRPEDVISANLLDGRTHLSRDEVRQLILLFGKPEPVRKELNRDVLDLRVVRDRSKRWDERQLIERENLLQSLGKTIEFLAKNVGADGVTIDGLRSSSGSADYIAIREAVVNLFIHQDYSDNRAAAQIEIQTDTATLSNQGFSLVDKEQLVQGGRSQSRNPLIARALRLIGFAELAGSGIRAMQYEWQKAKRRPPKFNTDRASNSFTLTLDWRLIPDIHDEELRKKLGVKLAPEQATALKLACLPDGVTVEQIASATGLTVEEANAAIDHLTRQLLVEKTGDCFTAKPHISEILSRASAPTSSQETKS